ncbi:MAG: hypothetical protein ACR2F6_00340 [Mycobacteriales bacterium]
MVSTAAAARVIKPIRTTPITERMQQLLIAKLDGFAAALFASDTGMGSAGPAVIDVVLGPVPAGQRITVDVAVYTGRQGMMRASYDLAANKTGWFIVDTEVVGGSP